MLGAKERADVAVKDSVVEMPHVLERVQSHSLPVPAPAWPKIQILPPCHWAHGESPEPLFL